MPSVPCRACGACRRAKHSECTLCTLAGQWLSVACFLTLELSSRWFENFYSSVSSQHCAAGPAISLDTACSSSLSATSLAARLLLEGSAARALTTAALLTLDPGTIGMLTAAGMLAPDGRCKTLDAAADGSVPLCSRL